MPPAERTYSFRASGDLGANVRSAVDVWSDVLHEATADIENDEVAREFFLAFFRRTDEFLAARDNQSALWRSIAEAFVYATQKVARDLEYVDEYEAWAREDDEATRIRSGALRAAAARWRDG